MAASTWAINKLFLSTFSVWYMNNQPPASPTSCVCTWLAAQQAALGISYTNNLGEVTHHEGDDVGNKYSFQPPYGTRLNDLLMSPVGGSQNRSYRRTQRDETRSFLHTDVSSWMILSSYAPILSHGGQRFRNPKLLLLFRRHHYCNCVTKWT